MNKIKIHDVVIFKPWEEYHLCLRLIGIFKSFGPMLGEIVEVGYNTYYIRHYDLDECFKDGCVDPYKKSCIITNLGQL